jgi:glycosyltransferase involved in cell wall biosynthesis
MPLPLPRVGVNALLLSADTASYRTAGIHVYIQNTLRYVLQQPAFALHVYLRNAQLVRQLQVPAQVQTHFAPNTEQPMRRILWEQTRLALSCHQAKLDLLHGMAFVNPLLWQGRQLVTVYDLSFVHFPERFRGFNRHYLTLFTRLSCRRADHLIAISQHTKRDLVACYGIDPAKISVVYPGRDERFQPQSAQAVADFRAQHGLPEKYVLYLGTIEPRKNLSTLINAFAKLGLPGVKLVCAGGRGWMYQDVFQTVEELHLQREVIFPGFVPVAELPLWYAASVCFVYPSSYEGFGMPVLEALSCGVPVVTTNASALPEVVGTAGLLVPPADSDALAEALRQVLTDQPLAEQLRLAGPQQAARFDWAQAGQDTVQAYQLALQGGRLPVA